MIDLFYLLFSFCSFWCHGCAPFLRWVELAFGVLGRGAFVLLALLRGCGYQSFHFFFLIFCRVPGWCVCLPFPFVIRRSPVSYVRTFFDVVYFFICYLCSASGRCWWGVVGSRSLLFFGWFCSLLRVLLLVLSLVSHFSFSSFSFLGFSLTLFWLWCLNVFCLSLSFFFFFVSRSFFCVLRVLLGFLDFSRVSHVVFFFFFFMCFSLSGAVVCGFFFEPTLATDLPVGNFYLVAVGVQGRPGVGYSILNG